MSKLLSPYQKHGFSLKNHIVMAPMTRSRATGNIPNDLMATYYAQRNGAGLIVTEGTSPSPEGLGYARIPGIFSDAQTEGWKKIAAAAHSADAKIFVQLMHTGRIGHADNLPAGSVVSGPSVLKAAGEIFTDTKFMQEHTTPVALSTEEVERVIADFVKAGENAVKAGLDGVELHGANGYLLEQFLHPVVNDRSDIYGGSIQNRARIVLEIASRTAAAIGKEKVGIRFSPYNTMGDLAAYDPDEVHATYAYLAAELNKIGIAYIHIMVAAHIPQRTFDAIRTEFTNTIILCGGLTPETAEEALNGGFADLVAFGRAFMANPDLPERIAKNAELAAPDFSTAYTPGAEGYIDYPVLQEA